MAVWTGSTNWTPTGLCAQTNNTIIIESEKIANDYLNYGNASTPTSFRSRSH